VFGTFIKVELKTFIYTYTRYTFEMIACSFLIDVTSEINWFSKIAKELIILIKSFGFFFQLN